MLLNIQPSDFAQFIDECTQEEWKLMHTLLTPEEQKNLPNSVDDIQKKFAAMRDKAFNEQIKHFAFLVPNINAFAFALGSHVLYLVCKRGLLVYDAILMTEYRDCLQATFLKDSKELS